METKTCRHCRITKSVEAFHPDNSYKSGRRSECISCRNKRTQLRRLTAKSKTATVEPKYTPAALTITEEQLPSPECLPAAYMKRVSDYWLDLIGGDEPVRRIA